MATNSILKFGGTATSILTDPQYLADPERSGGNQTGTTARSALDNKLGLQTSSVSSGIGQFLADNQPVDINDSLSPAAFSTIITDAIQQTGAKTIPYATNVVYDAVNDVYNVDAPGYDFTTDSPQSIGFRPDVNNVPTVPSAATKLAINGDVGSTGIMIPGGNNQFIAGRLYYLIRESGAAPPAPVNQNWYNIGNITKKGTLTANPFPELVLSASNYMAYNGVVEAGGFIEVDLPQGANELNFIVDFMVDGDPLKQIFDGSINSRVTISVSSENLTGVRGITAMVSLGNPANQRRSFGVKIVTLDPLETFGALNRTTVSWSGSFNESTD